MHRMRFMSGKGANFSATVPGGQMTYLWVVGGDPGTWVQIANSSAIWVPNDHPLRMSAADLGECCGAEPCDRFPGEQQIQIVIGQNVQRTPDNPDAPDNGAAPVTWLIAYNGAW